MGLKIGRKGGGGRVPGFRKNGRGEGPDFFNWRVGVEVPTIDELLTHSKSNRPINSKIIDETKDFLIHGK